MAQREIEVVITGEQGIKRVSDMITNLKKSVDSLEKDLARVGGSKSPTFSVKVRLDTQGFKDDFAKLKKTYQSDSKKIKFQTGLVSKGLNEDFKNLKKKFGDKEIKVNVTTGAKRSDASSTLREFKQMLNDLEVKAKVGVNKAYFRASLLSLRQTLDDMELTVKVKAKADASSKNTLKKELSGDTDKIVTKAVEAGSFNNLVRSTREANQNITDMYQKLLRISSLDPMRGMFGGMGRLGSLSGGLVRGANSLAGNFIGNTLSNLGYGAFSHIENVASAIITETREIGDSLVTYRQQLRALGQNDIDINKELRDLTNYGKKTVYDASNLITFAGQYKALGVENSNDLVKAIAGFSAQTANPNASMDGISRQLSQMMSIGKVTWADLRIMLPWMNALGANQLQTRLRERSNSLGYGNDVQTMLRKGDLSLDEFTQMFSDIGFGKDGKSQLQEFVNTIATPTQALSNMKEQIANLFQVPKIDENGNMGQAPLQKLYDSTTRFLLGISKFTDTDMAKDSVKRIGDDISETIDSLIGFGQRWNAVFGRNFASSIETLYDNFQEGYPHILKVTGSLGDLTRSAIRFNNQAGAKLGQGVGRITNSVIKLGQAFLDTSNQLTQGGFLDGVGGFLEVYANLAQFSNKSGFTKRFAEVFTHLTDTLNTILTKGNTIERAKGLVNGLGEFFDEFFSIVERRAVNEGALASLFGVAETIANGYTTLIRAIDSNIKPGALTSIFDNLSSALNVLFKGLSPIYGELAGGLANALGSTQGKKTMQALADFLVSIANLVKTIIANIGLGSVEQGFTTILTFVETLASALTQIVKFLSLPGISHVIAGVLVWKLGVVKFINFINKAISEISTLMSIKGLGGKSVYGGALNYGGSAVIDASQILAQPIKQQASKKVTSQVSKKVAGQAMKLPVSYGQTFTPVNASAFTKFTDLTKSSLKTAGNSLKTFGKNMTSLSGNVANLKTIGKSFNKGLFSPTSFFSSLALNGVNGAIQNNNTTPDWLKTASRFGTNIFNNASMFASLGSLAGPYGTIAGGVVGTVKGVWDSIQEGNALKQADKEAKAQAKEISEMEKAEVASYVESIKEVAKHASRSFYDSLKGGSGISNILSSSQFVQSVGAEGEMSFKQSLKNLGVNVQSVPKNIGNYFVKIGEDLVSWNDLREQTGLSDEELLGSLQNLNSTLGETTTNLLDQFGNVQETVQNLTNSELTQRSSQIENLKSSLSKMGLSWDSLGDYSVKTVNELNTAISDALKGKYNTKEDKKQAILDAIRQYAPEIADALQNKTLEEIQSSVKQVQGYLEEGGQTTEERHASLIEKIAKLKGVSKEKLGELVGKTVQELEGELASAMAEDLKTQNEKSVEMKERFKQLQTKISETSRKHFLQPLEKLANDINSLGLESVDEAQYRGYGGSIEDMREYIRQLGVKDKELQETIMNRMLKHGETFEEARQHILETGEATDGMTAEQLANLKTRNTEFLQHLVKLIENGVITTDEASEFLLQAGIDVNAIDTSVVGEKGQEVVRNVEKVKDSASYKLEEVMTQVAKGDSSHIDTSGLGHLASQISSGVAQTVESAKMALARALADLHNTEVDYKLGYTTKDKLDRMRNAVNLANKQNANVIGATNFAGGRVGGQKPIYRADGGLAQINWVRRGTDDVPTMLTKGEYVLRKKAVESVGVGFLNKLNRQGERALQNTPKSSTIYNVYNNNNAKVTQNVDNKSQYLNGMLGLDRLMRYV